QDTSTPSSCSASAPPAHTSTPTLSSSSERLRPPAPARAEHERVHRARTRIVRASVCRWASDMLRPAMDTSKARSMSM
ncbi:hypothetical protein H0H92_007257, partial [Tricholoma furcatifolium]